MRYEGQNSEISVEAGGQNQLLTVPELRARFLDTYKGIFGLAFPSYGIEVNTWTVEIAVPGEVVPARGFAYAALDPNRLAVKGTRPCVLDGAACNVPVDVPVFDRYALQPGWRTAGPALVEENETTIFLPAAAVAHVAPTLDIVAELSP